MADDSSFSAAWQAGGRPDLMSEFGEAATYTPSGGTGTEITVIVTAWSEVLEGDERGRHKRVEAEVEVSTVEVSDPNAEDTIVVRSVELTVTGVQGSEAGMATLECLRAERYEESREGYRISVRG